MKRASTAQTEQYENLVQAGVIDPTKVVRLGVTERGVDRIVVAEDRSGHLQNSGKNLNGIGIATVVSYVALYREVK